MFDVSSSLPLSVEFSADPIVIELRDRAGWSGEVRFEVYGVPKDQRLEVEVLPIAPAGGFTVEVAGKVGQRRAAKRTAQPVEVTLPLHCAVAAPGDGSEATTELTVRLRLRAAAARRAPDEPEADAEAPSASFSTELLLSAARILPLWQVLREEYLELAEDDEWRRRLRDDELLASPQAEDDEKLERVYELAHGFEPGFAALCFSGGGIRSATFNLGVLQGLVDAGLLGRFHYLSSVSGGGYVSSWLAGWVYRSRGLDQVTPYLEEPEEGKGVDVVSPEPHPIRFLRRYSNYLTPRLGALSPDTWTAAAIVLRNLILNWLVFLPILAAALALPLLTIAEDGPLDAVPVPALYVLGLLAGGVGLFFMSSLRASADPKLRDDRRPWSQRFLLLGLAPLLLAAGALGRAAALYVLDERPGFLDALPWCALWAVVTPLVAFALAHLWQRRLFRPRPGISLRRDLLALLGSGAVIACLYAGIVAGWVGDLLARPELLYPLLAPVLFLGPVLLGKSLFVAFASLAEGRVVTSAQGEEEREWWARWSGWTLIAVVVWLVAAAIAFFALSILAGAVQWATALVSTGGLGALVSQLGKSASGGKWKNVVMAIAAPLFCVALLLLVSAGTQTLLAVLWPAETASSGPSWWVSPYRGEIHWLLVAIVTLFLTGSLLGRFVNVNRFSLQALYRNRLIRAYLGATNPRRYPNLFTGFDPEDDLPLHRLRGNKPWPVVNIALNLVKGQDLAWQERKAESFTATPLHCGTARLGYRRSQLYGGEDGITVGTVVATSGAAASPNMGYHSSPSITFIMALFNARLGAWLGNPGRAGTDTYMRGGPRESAYLLVTEALGYTDDAHPYVYLSDGGHFENLGLYEMVRRRCRFLVVCDAGCDPTCRFDDLGNAIRKVRIDLGVPIEFEDRIPIYPKSEEPRQGAGYCALGSIDYPAIDGKGVAPGVLVYVKPAFLDRAEPYDVTNYAKTSADFPHESTADQWFSESQFESYRQLGKSTIGAILRPGPHPPPLAGLRELRANVEKYLAGNRAGQAAS